jgi:hypothetical protein
LKINRRVVIIVAAVLLLIVLIIGFANGLFIRKHGFGDQKYQVTVVKNVDDLEDRSFYIQKENGTYERPYVGDTTFTGDSTSGKIRVAWFGKDYDRIPTMHRGEKVVYRSKYEFNPSFSVERFQDIGYTIGICGMSPTSTGRYAFSTNPESRSIDVNSSAGFLTTQGELPRAYAALAKKKDNVAFVDMFTPHKTLLGKKDFISMSGNNINHPNDWLIRVYTMQILSALIEY